MKYTEILKRIEPLLNDADHSFLSYNSPVDEAVKLSIRAKNSAKPIVIVKENAYLANRLKEILLSYFDDEEIVSYLPDKFCLSHNHPAIHKREPAFFEPVFLFRSILIHNTP